jgi:hypothetical protein
MISAELWPALDGKTYCRRDLQKETLKGPELVRQILIDLVILLAINPGGDEHDYDYEQEHEIYRRSRTCSTARK